MTMIASSSRISSGASRLGVVISRRVNKGSSPWLLSECNIGGRSLSSTAVASHESHARSSSNTTNMGLLVAATAAVAGVSFVDHTNDKTQMAAAMPSSGDIISLGTPVEEPSTGILFPQLCNGFYFVGAGVRVKYGFVKVYAVGTYIDPIAMNAVIKSKNTNVMEEALLDPTYPRTIRIVMNRSLSIDKYTSAIVEALKPRMMGQDLETLEEFKSLNPPVDLVQGTFGSYKCIFSYMDKYWKE